MPVPIPSEILPKIASGPMAKIKEAETKPSTKFELLFLLNLFFNFSPTASSLSSIARAEPINAPINNEKIRTRMTQPFGIDFWRSTSQ